MRKLILLILICSGCNSKSMEKKYDLTSFNSSGLEYSSSTIKCDSFQMISFKKAIFWNNGARGIIEAERYISASSY